MQYPYRVAFGGRQTYVVRANDSGQAVRRAMREHERQNDGQKPDGRIWVKSLTPKEVDGRFLPRVGGTVVGGAFTTWAEAVDFSVTESLKIAMERGRSEP